MEEEIANLLEQKRNDNEEIPLPKLTYRFKLSNKSIDEINIFAKIHQFDDRHEFKEAWNEWIEENKELIDDEKKRLSEMGYVGDTVNKMFKSARYYFKNKSEQKITPKIRREYVSVPRELLDAMDIHIRDNIYNEDYKPKTGFCEFSETNEELLKEAISKIIESGIKDRHAIEAKLKKTYKNRYFTLTNK
jgi:hypothetical protein